ncbi:hypothetical protein C5167_022325 [Papaver somniferum]|uniref:Uncharacterized protein n=1 Tax=Papaver somniferum TaxID=3469 RepID=A0A4Y7JJ01_PAPSO|nr:hypothetical protein C5167_022325 [Papaver somniferum]
MDLMFETLIVKLVVATVEMAAAIKADNKVGGGGAMYGVVSDGMVLPVKERQRGIGINID